MVQNLVQLRHSFLGANMDADLKRDGRNHLIAMSTVSFPCAAIVWDGILSLQLPITTANFYNIDCSKINNALPILHA